MYNDPLTFEELLEKIDKESCPVITNAKIECLHKFIPLFNTICCKHCGMNKSKEKDNA